MNNKNKKTIVLSLALATGLLWPMAANAQDKGGVFGKGASIEREDQGGMLRGNSLSGGFMLGAGGTENPVPTPNTWGFDLGGGNEENPTPLGSGMAILVAAGAGYVTLKKKKEEKQ